MRHRAVCTNGKVTVWNFGHDRRSYTFKHKGTVVSTEMSYVCALSICRRVHVFPDGAAYIYIYIYYYMAATAFVVAAANIS